MIISKPESTVEQSRYLNPFIFLLQINDTFSLCYSFFTLGFLIPFFQLVNPRLGHLHVHFFKGISTFAPAVH